MNCRVYKCRSRKSKNSTCSFFSFPKDDNIARKWVAFCRQYTKFNLDTSYICSKHFTDNDFHNVQSYKLGYAKRPLLRRGAVPTIYPSDMPTAVSQSHNDSDNKLLELRNGGVSYEGNEEYSSGDDFADASTSPTSGMVYVNADLEEVEVEETEIDKLKRENEQLKKLKSKQSSELNRLDIQFRSNAYEVVSLQNRLDKMTVAVKTMEDKLSAIFTTGQIAKLKAGSKQRIWSEEDIAISTTLYAASPKLYRIMHKQGFPLPGVRTLQTYSAMLG